MEIIILYTKKSNYWSQNGWTKERLCLARCNPNWRWQSKSLLSSLLENGGSSSGKKQWKAKTMIKLNGPHLWLTYTAVHQVQLHLRDGFQHLDLFGVKQEIDLVKRKPWNWLKFTEPWDLMTPNPFSFLHTFSFFLYFHMLSSS